MLPLFKAEAVLVLGDREFHSPKLAAWLDSRGVKFALRQKKDLHIKAATDTEYTVVDDLGIQPGMKACKTGLLANKGDGLGPFNLAIYWQRKYRNKGSKSPWYILTNLPDWQQAIDLYRCRWGIEQLFKDYKTGGYNLEDTQVNQDRFLALVLLIAIAYRLATLQGQQLRDLGIEQYAGRLQEHRDKTLRHSDFSLSLYGLR